MRRQKVTVHPYKMRYSSEVLTYWLSVLATPSQEITCLIQLRVACAGPWLVEFMTDGMYNWLRLGRSWVQLPGWLGPLTLHTRPPFSVLACLVTFSLCCHKGPDD